jgi:HEAT repeat protein
MNDFIDGVLEPFLWLLGDWSLRWGVVILLFAGWLVFLRPRRAGGRYVVGLVALTAGLLIPVLPRWGAGFGSLAIQRPGPVIVADRLAPEEPSPNEKLTVDVLPLPDPEPAERSSVEQPAEVVGPTMGPSIQPRGEPLGAKRLVFLSLSIVWLAGMLVLILRRLGGWLLLERMRRTALAVQGAPADVFLACRKELGLRRPATLATHPRVRSPITLGLLHPTILVPANWPDLPESTQRGSLLHELAHLGRYDDAFALLFELVRVVFFFHPLVRWLLARLERERELLCDETALARGLEPREYARMLMEFARQPGRLLPAPFIDHLYPIHFGNHRTVRIRINRLLEGNMYRWMSPLPPARAVLLAVLALAMVLPLGSVRIHSSGADGQSPLQDVIASRAVAKQIDESQAAELLAAPQPAQKIEPFRVLNLYCTPIPKHVRREGVDYKVEVPAKFPLRTTNDFLVDSSGKIDLGESLGRVELGGLTLEEATTVIEERLEEKGWKKTYLKVHLSFAAGSKESLSYGGKNFNAWRTILMTDLKPEVRADAIKALAALGTKGYGEEAAAAIIDTMRDYDVTRQSSEDGPVIQAAFTGIRRLGVAAVPSLITELRSGRTNGRRFAGEALSRLGPAAKAAVPALLAAAAKDIDFYVRGRAVTALCLDPKAEGVVSPLITALKDENAGVRASAADALGRLGPAAKAAVPALIAALKDENETVHSCAIRALVKTGVESKTFAAVLDANEAVPVLVQMLNETTPEQGTLIVQTLGEMGPNAREAAPTLSGLRRSPPSRNKIDPKIINEALEKIRSDGG